ERVGRAGEVGRDEQSRAAGGDQLRDIVVDGAGVLEGGRDGAGRQVEGQILDGRTAREGGQSGWPAAEVVGIQVAEGHRAEVGRQSLGRGVGDVEVEAAGEACGDAGDVADFEVGTVADDSEIGHRGSAVDSDVRDGGVGKESFDTAKRDVGIFVGAVNAAPWA